MLKPCFSSPRMRGRCGETRQDAKLSLLRRPSREEMEKRCRRAVGLLIYQTESTYSARFKAEGCSPEWPFQMQWSSDTLQNHERRNGRTFLHLISVGTTVPEHFPWLKGNRNDLLVFRQLRNLNLRCWL